MSALYINPRLLSVCRRGASLIHVYGMPRFRIAALGSTQVATLIATHGKPLERKAPWPYKEIPYNIFLQGFDRTTRRLDENSKIIVVEGNLATGKSEMAKFIAKEFDLLHVPAVTMDDLFIYKDRWFGDCDIRQFDEQLPPAIRSYTIESFYRDPKPIASRVGLLQFAMYKERFMKYCKGMHHMLNTGQGIVIEKSPFGDFIYAEALKKFGYMTQEGLDHYYRVRRDTIIELMEPHLTVYLDTPVEKVKENIRKRGVPYEVDNPILSDGYLQAIEDGYKKNFLNTMSKTGHVMRYDTEDGLDFEFISEQLERYDLEDPDEENNDRFDEWNMLREDDWALKRKFYGSKWQLEAHFNMPEPYDAPELMPRLDDLITYADIVLDSPEMRYYPPERPSLRKMLSFPKKIYQASSWY